MNHYPYMFNRGGPPFPNQGYMLPPGPPGFVPPGFGIPHPNGYPGPGGYIPPQIPPPHPGLMMNQPMPPQMMGNPNLIRNQSNTGGLLVPPQLHPHPHPHSHPQSQTGIIISQPQHNNTSPTTNNSNSPPHIPNTIMTTPSGLVSKFSLPVTSVFIGKIPPGVSDDFIRLLIEQCGTFSKWTRGSDASGKLKGFGFCEFNTPEGALRALRLLNDLEILDQGKLSVKVEDKVQNFLNEYLENKKKQLQKQTTTTPDDSSNSEHNSLDFEQQERLDDIAVVEMIKVLIERHKPIIEENRKNELPSEPINVDIFSKDRKDLTKDEKLRVIEREIEKEQLRDRERDGKRKDREYRDYKKEEESWESRERNKEREREKEKEKERDRIKYESYYRNRDMEEYSDSDEKLRKRFRSEKAYKLRQREKEEDRIDREKEQDELNQIKQQKIAEQLEKEKKLKQFDDNLNKIRLKKLPSTSIIASGFNSMDDHDQSQDNNIFKKKQTFIPLDNDLISSNLNNTNNTNSIVRTKEEIQELISKIPTEKEDLLKMKMEWDIIDRLGLVEKEMKPWISKKVSEFMGGAEEPLLNEHIIELLKSHHSPSSTIEKLSSVLENHTEEFVLKMFRKLAYLEKSSS